VPEAIARYALLAPVEELTRLHSAPFFSVREALPRRHRREERGATQLAYEGHLKFVSSHRNGFLLSAGFMVNLSRYPKTRH
jgi:hypothetical protein